MRASTGSHPRFALPRGGSPGFASAAGDWNRPVRTRLRCGSAQPSPRRRPRLAGSFFNRHAVTPQWVLRLLAGARFQALFHSPPGVLFTFPSRYSSAVGRRGVLSLGGRSPLLPAGFLVPGGTRDRVPEPAGLAYGALTLCRAPSHASSALLLVCDSGRTVRGAGDASSTPAAQRAHARCAPPVWAGPLSLAATRGVSVDFPSSGYLDVSVPPVAPRQGMCSQGG